jgi:hypothetical protein
MQNQGLYIKMGQAIGKCWGLATPPTETWYPYPSRPGLQASLLPKPYKEAFANIFDAAPNIPIEEIQQVFREDFAGKVPNQLFTSFSETPIASASIAQVHEAVIDRHEILPDGSIGKRWQEKVAVKVQKPAIRKQMEWDLWSYRTLMYLTEKLFAMPSMSTGRSMSRLSWSLGILSRQQCTLCRSALCWPATADTDVVLQGWLRLPANAFGNQFHEWSHQRAEMRRVSRKHARIEGQGLCTQDI